ncbi:jg4752, partial [Pararge aegeria aegeria]
SSDLIAYLKEQLESKEKELFVVVSQEVEEKQLWMNQFILQGNGGHEVGIHRESALESPDDSSPVCDFSNRDAECLRLNEVNCVRENF